jgi:hypothetical protein
LTPSKSFWNIKTDATINGTVVRFYTADSQLVYQESIPNHYIELNSRNIRRLDQTLAHLVDNQLVAATITTSELRGAETPATESSRVQRRRMREAVTNPADLAFKVQSFALEAKPAVHVLVNNPARDRLTIRVLSAENKTVYETICQMNASRHRLNFTGMPSGTYQIEVKSSTQRYSQPVTVGYAAKNEYVQLENERPQQETNPVASRK